MTKDYLIIANGPFLIHEIIKEAMEGMRIIALDGAANKLFKLGIVPDVVLGDFDSILPDVYDYYCDNAEVILAENQDQTDLDKAIAYCDRQQADSITVICATGGREDHHQGVMHSLRLAYRPDRPIVLHSDQQTMRWAKDETIQLVGVAGDHCGIIANSIGSCCSKGLRYECKNHEYSICNRMLDNTATLNIKGWAWVIMPPLLQGQREYLALSEKEQLLIKLRDLQYHSSNDINVDWGNIDERLNDGSTN